MEYLKIQSKGEIEQLAFTLIGNSTKRGDASQIGMFGSGLKYAISALLRNNIKFHVFAGEKEFKFELKDQAFRSENFRVITLNGEQTSFTSSMGGKDWDNPFAPVREIYSNALDEDEEATISRVHSIHGREGATTFYIEMTNEVRDFYNNIEDYFCIKNPDVLFSNRAGSVYRSARKEIRLFRKGILSHSSNAYACQFNYNSGYFKINESRVISDMYSAYYTIGDIWKLCKDEDLILEFMQGMFVENSFHTRIDFGHNYSDTPLTSGFSKAWENVVRREKFASHESVFLFDASQLAGRIFLPHSLLVHLKEQFHFIDIIGLRHQGTGLTWNIIEPNQALNNKVIDALSLLFDTRYKDRLDNPSIKFCRFDKDATLAKAHEGIILLSEKLSTKSVPEIAKIIVEENEHNVTGYGDKTRSFQNHLFDLYFDELQHKTKLQKLVE